MMETAYASKRDLWLTSFVAASALATAACGVAVWSQPIGWERRFIISGVCAAASLFIVDLLLRTDYTLERESLRVRCGLFRWRVPFHAIASIRPSRTWVSGPALSLDRLVITRSDSIFPLIISPESQQQFLEDVASRDAGLLFADGQVIRREIE